MRREASKRPMSRDRCASSDDSKRRLQGDVYDEGLRNPYGMRPEDGDGFSIE